MSSRRQTLKRDTALAAAALYQSLFPGHSREDGDSSGGVQATFQARPGSGPSRVAGRPFHSFRASLGRETACPFPLQVIYMTGWAPHDSQQRARKRGSATVSLKDLEKGLGATPSVASQPPTSAADTGSGGGCK